MKSLIKSLLILFHPVSLTVTAKEVAGAVMKFLTRALNSNLRLKRFGKGLKG